MTTATATYRAILVPLDGSPLGEQALPLALGIARRTGASVQLAHVHVPLAPADAEVAVAFDDVPEQVLRQREQGYLDRVVKRVRALSPVPVTGTLLEGAVVRALQDWAASTCADLVVMTTHGHGPLARFWIGSVADELIRRMPVPVLVTRPHDPAEDTPVEPALRKVLVPLDGSPLAEQILEPAVALARSAGAEYTLLRVISPLVRGPYDPADPAASLDPTLLGRLEALHEEEAAAARSYLDAVADRLRQRGLCVHTRTVIHEQPAAAILDHVRTYRPDVVALATHGRSGLPRLFLGSVADKVVRGTTLPVLIHRPLHRI